MADRKDSGSWSGVIGWVVACIVSVVILAIAVPARRQNADLAKFETAFAVVNDPAARVVSFGSGSQSARGRFFLSPGKGILFTAANLPKLEPGKTFELWLVPAGGKPFAAGAFQGKADATAVFLFHGSTANLAEARVTIEPEGGSSQPTASPFLTIPL